MLTTAPHLQVRRPSPTTAEFTVTTCPPPTLSNRLLLALVFAARVLLAASVLLLLYTTWTLHAASDAPNSVIRPASTSNYTTTLPIELDKTQSHNKSTFQATVTIVSPPPPPRPTTLYTTAWAPYLLAHLLHASQPLQAAAATLHVLPPSLLLPASLALLYLATLRIHATESLLVLRGLGIQTASTGGSYLAAGKTRFIPTEKIRDVLINEAFRGLAVRYYLVIVVDGEEDVVVVFPRLLPRRRIVERVWRGCRGCLWEPTEGGYG